MAAIERHPVQFSLPLTPSSYNSHALRRAQPGQSLRANSHHYTQNMPKHNQPNQLHKGYGQLKPLATNTSTRPTCQDGADWNLAARAEGNERTLANDDEGSDDDIPSLNELFRATGPPNISSQASTRERSVQSVQSVQNPVKPDLDVARMHIDQTVPGLGKGQGDTRGSQDRPVIIEEDEAEDTSSSRDANTGRVKPDTSPHNVLATSELTSSSATSISAPSVESWWDVEKGHYVYEPVLGPGSREQQGVPTAPAQGQPHGLRQSSKPPQDQIKQQDIGNAAQSTSVESATPPHSLPKPSDTGDGGWTEDSVAEPEEELGLAMVEQVESPPASAPDSSYPPRSEESQDEIGSRQRSETARSRPEELRDGSQHATLDQDLEWEQRETRVAVEIVEGVAAVEVASEAASEEGEKERDDGNSEPEQCGEKRRRQDKTSSSSQHFDTSDDEHDATWEEAGDEDTPPAKRRSLRRESTRNALIPAPNLPLQRPHSPTPSATQPEITDKESQADHTHLLSPVDGRNHHTPRTPQSCSPMTEKAPVAEYQEWPFQSFLKCARIGNETMYHLEINLPQIPERLTLSFPLHGSGMSSSREVSADVVHPHEAVAHSKTYAKTSRPQTKPPPWTREEEATVIRMKKDKCSWEEIHAALPHRSSGTIQVRYSTKLKKKCPAKGKQRRL